MLQHIHVSPLGFLSDLQGSTKQINNNKEFIYIYLFITKHLTTCTKGNSEFCFPETLNTPSRSPFEAEGKQNSLFPTRPVTKNVLLYLPTQN